MNDWGTNSFNRIMRERAEENAFRAYYPPQCGRIMPDDIAQQEAEHFRNMPPCEVTNVRVSVAPTTWKFGILFRWGSFWIGAHYAPHNKRLCINLVPFVTIWITAPGGRVP